MNVSNSNHLYSLYNSFIWVLKHLTPDLAPDTMFWYPSLISHIYIWYWNLSLELTMTNWYPLGYFPSFIIWYLLLFAVITVCNHCQKKPVSFKVTHGGPGRWWWWCWCWWRCVGGAVQYGWGKGCGRVATIGEQETRFLYFNSCKCQMLCTPWRWVIRCCRWCNP